MLRAELRGTILLCRVTLSADRAFEFAMPAAAGRDRSTAPRRAFDLARSWSRRSEGSNGSRAPQD